MSDFPAASIVVRKDDYVAAGEGPLDELAGRLVAAGKSVLCTPETVVVAATAGALRPASGQALTTAGGVAVRSGGAASAR